MVIDFHAHIFPDALAPKAMDILTKDTDGAYIPVSDGTAAGLIESMDKRGVTVSVNQPVVTKQSQVRSTNEWAANIVSDRILSFGGIYPHTDDYKRDIDFVVGLGLKGIKFHCEYQDFILDDPKMLKIYDYALDRGLIIIHHAGDDPAFKPPFKSSPQRFLNIALEMKGGIMIAAHFGGHCQWDDVLAYLAGSNIYFDTSMGFEYFTREQFLNIVKKHGADKILFGSDAPWSDAGTEIAKLRSMPLPEDDINAILSGNAKRILGL